jgi:hypothetical protein
MVKYQIVSNILGEYHLLTLWYFDPQPHRQTVAAAFQDQMSPPRTVRQDAAEWVESEA